MNVYIIFEKIGYDGYYGEIENVVKVVSNEEKAKKI